MASDPERAASVYDFIYVDHDRIGLLLSQLSDDGLLTEIVKQSEAGDDSDWGVDIKLVRASSKQTGKRSLSRRFNTRWLLPLLLLDKIKDRLVSPEELRVGSLIKANGVLTLLNTELLQQLYKSDHLRNVTIKRAKAAQKAEGNQFDLDSAKVELEAMTAMDQHVQMHMFRGDDFRLWSTLAGNSLVTPASELSMKHGNIIAGNWTVIGILDALPWDPESAADTQARLLNRFSGQNFLKEAIQINDGIKAAYGRASDTVGVTTLAIFREIG